MPAVPGSGALNRNGSGLDLGFTLTFIEIMTQLGFISSFLPSHARFTTTIQTKPLRS
jgi:hypothetical protein